MVPLLLGGLEACLDARLLQLRAVHQDLRLLSELRHLDLALPELEFELVVLLVVIIIPCRSFPLGPPPPVAPLAPGRALILLAARDSLSPWLSSVTPVIAVIGRPFSSSSSSSAAENPIRFVFFCGTYGCCTPPPLFPPSPEASAIEWKPPAEISLTPFPCIVSIRTGVVCICSSSWPSRPYSPLPHEYTSPLSSMTIVWCMPADTRVTRLPRSASTTTGMFCMFSSPWPSWPLSPPPHV
mmetsp:Transcript_64595/g.154411  ORF Transcript_64595/g.154411 Transcript_64595/m.154411 type:complete len:240 (+) Transcript_64595:716-1435(+)